MNSTTFTVFFEGPFWVGILEISDDDGIRAARHIFGDEPSGPELYAFGLSRDYDRLLRRALAGLPGAVPTPAVGDNEPEGAARAAAKERRLRRCRPLLNGRSRQPSRNPRPRSGAGPAPSGSRRGPPAEAGACQSQGAASWALIAVLARSRRVLI